MGRRRKGGTLPGMNGHARTTPIWVFVLHLSVVFMCTWGALMAFEYGHRVIGVCLAGVWVVAFVITSMDNVRIRAFEWTRVYVLVALDAVGMTKRKGSEGHVHEGQTRPDLDVDRG